MPTNDAPWRLRPGFPVLRRDVGALQVGVRRPHAAVLPDRPSVRALLVALERGADTAPLDDVARLALHRLVAAGLVVPANDVAAVPAAERMLFGADARRRLAARRTTSLGVTADDRAAEDLADLLSTAGLAVAADADAADVRLVVTAGPLRRGLLDPLVQHGVPHLVVQGDGPARRVGPFVAPGSTACLRCVDAHESHADPRLPLLLEQAADSAGQAPPPLDPLLVRMALAWAVRDLARYAEGDEPSTWSATVDIGATDPPVLTRWLRHPDCGCAWDTLLQLP